MARTESTINASGGGEASGVDESRDDDIAVGALSITGVVFVLFVAGVYAYANYGGGFVNQLSGELGEVVAARGVTAQKAGETEDAIRLYQLALQKGFGDPRQRFWTQERLSESLLQVGQSSEAAENAQEALKFDGTDPKLHYLLTVSLWQAKRLEEALAAAKAWKDLVAKADEKKGQVTPLWYQGMIYSEMGQKDKALDAYLEGARLDPKDRNGYHAAVILHELHRDQEALDLLEAFIPDATGPRAEAAKKLREAIAASKPSR